MLRKTRPPFRNPNLCMIDFLLLYCSDYSVARFGETRKEFPPLGVLYLAAACEQQNIRVKLLDLSQIEPGKIPLTDVIGLSINSSYIYPAFQRRIEEIRTKCTLLLAGGQHVSIFPKETCEDLKTDYVLVGEGEYSLPELLCHISRSGFSRNISDVRNVYNPETVSLAKYTEQARIRNLDALPFPARHLLPDDDILLRRRIPGVDVLSTNVITSRGCPYGCRFCGNVYKGFSFRSGKNVQAEIEFLQERYPQLQGIVFLDENLFFNKEHAFDILNCMKQFDLLWTCNARVDGFTKDILPYFRAAGCVEIKYGIESGSQRILNRMNKGISVSDIETTLRTTVQCGIRTKCFLMFGYPGDCVETALETISFLKRNKDYIGRVNLFSFSPVPNSPVYNSGECNDFSWEDYRIYHQLQHWWGTREEYLEVKKGYSLLREYVDESYGER